MKDSNSEGCVSDRMASAWLLLTTQGFADSDIQKITGHASSEMIHSYDKSDRADNASKRVNLVG